MLPSLRSRNIKGMASSVHSVSGILCLSLSRVCMRLLVRPARSSIQHLRHVCGFSPARNCCRKVFMLLEFCMSRKSASNKLNFSPASLINSSSAKQHGRTVPTGLASRLTQGNTQNLSCGMFILMPLIQE